MTAAHPESSGLIRTAAAPDRRFHPRGKTEWTSPSAYGALGLCFWVTAWIGKALRVLQASYVRTGGGFHQSIRKRSRSITGIHSMYTDVQNGVAADVARKGRGPGQ